MAVKKYYAIVKGKKNNVIVDTWDECKELVQGISGAIYKSFKSKEEAKNFLKNQDNVNPNEEKQYKPMHEKAKELSMKKDTLCIYTDGSWGKKEDGKKIYAGGIVIIDNGKIVDRLCVSGEKEGFNEMQNVSGELQAAVRAIDYVIKNRPDIKNVHLFVDYEGLIHWANKTWKRKNQYTQQYCEYVNKKRQQINIKFHHTKGHNKDIYNEEADALAGYSKLCHLENREPDINEFLEKYSYIEKIK